MPEIKPIIISRWESMWTATESDSIPDFYLANAKNVDLSSDGSIGTLKQFTITGNRIETDGRIKSMYTYRLVDGSEVMIRLDDDGSNGTVKYFNTKNETWEQLVASLTKGNIMGFAPINTSDGSTVTNILYWCNGVENLTTWNGATTYLTVATSGGEGTITVNDTSNFDSSGTIIIGGTAVTYSGKTSITFTGCSSTPAAAINAGAAQQADTSTLSSAPKFVTMVNVDARIGGFRKNEIRWIYSNQGDGATYTVNTGPTKAGIEDLAEGNGNLITESAIKNWWILFKEDAVIGINIDVTDDNAAKIVRRKFLAQGEGRGAASAQGIRKIGDEIYYVSSNGGVKVIRLDKNNNELIQDDITEIIRPTIKNWDASSAAMGYSEKEKKLVVAYKVNSDSAQNDRCLIIDFVPTLDDKGNVTLKRKLSWTDWHFNCFTNFDGELYGGGSYEQNVFKIFDGYTKDDTPFETIITLKRYNLGTPYNQKQFLTIPITGRIQPGTVLKFQLDYDYARTKAHIEGEWDSVANSKPVIQPNLNTIGSFENGSEPIGGTFDDIDELNYFKLYLQLPDKHHPYDLQLTIWGDSQTANLELIGNRFLINNVGFRAVDSGTTEDKYIKINLI